MNLKAFAADVFDQVAGMFAANELAFAALQLERIGQRQATHDMPRAYLQRGIDAESDL